MLPRYSLYAVMYGNFDELASADVEREADPNGQYVLYRDVLKMREEMQREIDSLRRDVTLARSESRRSEDQRTISKWAVETFGEAGTNVSCAARAMVEVAELVFELAKNDKSPKGPEEIADGVICLYRVAERFECDLHEEVDKKMKINREREWDVVDGHGQHRE